MKIYRYSLWIFLVLLTGLCGYGQQVQERRGSDRMERYAYIDAIRIYERVAQKGYESATLFQNLGDAYYFNGKLDKAAPWYEKLFAEVGADSLDNVYYYRYAQALKSVSAYGESDRYLAQFHERERADLRGLHFRENKDYLSEIRANSGRYQIDSIGINSVYSDYGSAVYKGHLIFASARDTGSYAKRVHTWTGESFTSLYAAALDSAGRVTDKVKPFAKELRSKFNESTPVFSPDGKTMYFTRNNYHNGKRGRDARRTTLLKIYKARLSEEGRWVEEAALPFNSDAYSTAHPALTPDGRWMYFASDREGGYGQSDLYRVALHPDGSFGDPENLGEAINTEGRESFPFVSKQNELYFSTDGRPGLGGLDIYAVKLQEDGSFGEVQNIGAPANSAMDDFAYYIDSESRLGYLSSNRKGGTGGDDIYGFAELRELELDCRHVLSGRVYDKSTGEVLSGARVVLYDVAYRELQHLTTDAQGRYRTEALDCGMRYRLLGGHEEYNAAEVTVDLPKSTGETTVDFGLERSRVEVKKGDDLFKVLQLQPIYFDFDKDEIRPDAALELAKVVEVLEQYPQMKIDVRSHTDSRGNDAYNLKLSDRRARSTVRWIVAQGIAQDRVSGKGYGETQLVNECSNGVACSEAAHQENRRSEFIVLEL